MRHSHEIINCAVLLFFNPSFPQEAHEDFVQSPLIESLFQSDFYAAPDLSSALHATRKTAYCGSKGCSIEKHEQ